MTLLAKIYTKGILCVLLVAQLIACSKNDYTRVNTQVVWNPNFSAPIGKSHFSASDLPSSQWMALSSLKDTFVVEKTTPFDFSKLFENTEAIHYVMFRTYIENGFPATIKTQSYFLDRYNNIIDSLYENGPALLASAEIDNDGNLLSPVSKTIDEYRLEEDVDVYESVRQVYSKVWLYDFEFTDATFIESYYFNLETGLQADVEKENKE